MFGSTVKTTARSTALAAAFALAATACEGAHPEFEITEYPELEAYLQQEQDVLTSYAQVDQAKGVYRIPVDRAIELVAADDSLLEPFGPVLEQQKKLETMTVAERGGYHFNVTYACGACHSLEGAKMVGPALNNRWGNEALLEGGEAVAFNDAYFRESVWYSTKKIARGYQPVMPQFADTMTEEHFAAIMEFVKQYQ